jgi:hypothetical protein
VFDDIGVAVAVALTVGALDKLDTITVVAPEPRFEPLRPKAVTERVCCPSCIEVESQTMDIGGLVLIQLPSQ